MTLTEQIKFWTTGKFKKRFKRAMTSLKKKKLFDSERQYLTSVIKQDLDQRGL